MTTGFIIAIVTLVLVALIALLGLAILGLAAFLWSQSARHRTVPPRPAPIEDPATELFDRASLYAIYDSDDLDKTELVRLEGGILIDGRTDPAISLSELPRRRRDKE